MANPTERTANSVPSLVAKSNAGNGNDVILWADPATHALLISGSISISGLSGSKSNNAAAPTSDNLGALVAVANASAPTWTEGNQVLLSTDLSGQLRVTGSLSVGGTADGATFTAGSSTGTPAMGAYHSVIDTVADGKSAIIGITNKRAMMVSLFDASGNALLGQKAMASSVPVVLASDQASIPVAATLSAETTKVIGVVRNSDGAGNLLTTNSTTYTAKFALDGNLLGTLGTAFSTAGKVDVKGADGDVFVRQATGTNLHTVVDSGTITTVTTVSAARIVGNGGAVLDGVNTAATAPANGILGLGIYNSTEPSPTTGQSVGIQLDSKGRQRMVVMDAAGNTRGQNVNANNAALVAFDQTTLGTTNGVSIAAVNAAAALAGNGVTGTGSLRVTLASDNTAIANWGQGATGSAVPSGAQYKGLLAKTANPSAASDGNLVGAMADKLGRQVVVVGNVRDNKGNANLTLTASTSETTLIAAVASTFLDVYGIIIENTSATATEVVFRDSTAGTVQFNIYVPAGDTRGFMLPSSDAFKQTTVNTAWTAQCTTSVSSIKITALYVKNV